MRNFVKVLLVGTVLAGACVLLPNDSWAASQITGVSTTLKGWKKNIAALISDGTGGLEAGAAYVYTGGFFGNRNNPSNYTKIGDVKTNNIGQLVVRTEKDVYTMSRGNQITANKNITNAIHANNNAVTPEAAIAHLQASNRVPDGATVSVSKNKVTVTHNGNTSVYTQEGGSYRDQSGNIVATTGASGGRPNIASANMMDEKGSVASFVTNARTSNEAITMALHNQYPNAEVKINAAGNGGTIQIDGKDVPFSADVSSSSTGTRVRYTVEGNNNLKQDTLTPTEAGWKALGNTFAAVPEILFEDPAEAAAVGVVAGTVAPAAATATSTLGLTADAALMGVAATSATAASAIVTGGTVAVVAAGTALGYEIGSAAVEHADPVNQPSTGVAPTFQSDAIKNQLAKKLGVSKEDIIVTFDEKGNVKVSQVQKGSDGEKKITPVEATVRVTPTKGGSVDKVEVELDTVKDDYDDHLSKDAAEKEMQELMEGGQLEEVPQKPAEPAAEQNKEPTPPAEKAVEPAAEKGDGEANENPYNEHENYAKVKNIIQTMHAQYEQENLTPEIPAAGLNHNNVSVLGNLLGGEDLEFNREGTALGRLGKDIFNWTNDLDPNKGAYSMTQAQQETLKNLYGITFDAGTQQISFSGKEGDLGAGVVNYMKHLSEANGGKGYQSLLQDHAVNAQTVRAAPSAIAAAEAKLKAAKTPEDRQAAQAALDKIKKEDNEAKAAFQKTRAALEGFAQEARALHTQALTAATIAAADSNLTDAETAAVVAALSNNEFAAARDIVDKSLAANHINAEEAKNLMDNIATVENTNREAEAKEADLEKAEMPAAGPTETDMTDVLRTAAVVAMPFVTETELALRADVNILAGDIGEAVAVAEDTALSDVDVDASMPSTVSGAAMVVAELLKNATVDLKLLDETFEEEEKKPVIQMGGLAGAGSQTGVSATLNTPAEEEEEQEEEKKYLTDEQVNQIHEKRQMLLKQYVNAAVQISEGMNAVSNKFADRANVLISFSEGVQNEASAFGLTQDVGRYVLLESLRAVALSSAQMGVQAARMLNEQEVDNEIK